MDSDAPLPSLLLPTRDREVIFPVMRLRSFGHAGRVPAIGLGSWKMERDDRAQAIAALRRGLDLGLTHVDTAELYGSGEVEAIVGEAIAGRREQVFVVSKVVPEHASYEGTLRACENSLRRLRTEWLDSYLLHWPGRYPLSDTVRAFEHLERSGKIRSWGVSNFDVGELDEALAVAGPGRIACNQVLYNLQERTIEGAILDWCTRHGVALVGYSPFGAGRFPARTSPGGRVLAEVARARGATPHQVALAFLTRDPNVLAIPKAARAAHVEDVAGAADMVLTEDEIRRLDAAFPRPAAARRQPG
jgi:diketogulonate reductase-like aldo/keto reductase